MTRYRSDVVPASKSDWERDMGVRRVNPGETAGSSPPRSSTSAFQCYQRMLFSILEDAARELPKEYPVLTRILVKKLEREM